MTARVTASVRISSEPALWRRFAAFRLKISLCSILWIGIDSFDSIEEPHVTETVHKWVSKPPEFSRYSCDRTVFQNWYLIWAVYIVVFMYNNWINSTRKSVHHTFLNPSILKTLVFLISSLWLLIVYCSVIVQLPIYPATGDSEVWILPLEKILAVLNGSGAVEAKAPSSS